MRASKIFSRPGRILTIVLFFAALFVCTVPGTPVPIYIALAGSVVQIFSGDSTVYIVVDRREKSHKAYLWTTQRDNKKARPPELEQSLELYPAMTLQNCKDGFVPAKPASEEDLNPISVGAGQR